MAEHENDKGDKIPDKPDGGKPQAGKDMLIHFKVNGVELESQFDKLVASDILRMAKEKGAFEGKPEDYILEYGGQSYKPHDWVELKEGEELLALLAGPTQVA